MAGSKNRLRWSLLTLSGYDKPVYALVFEPEKEIKDWKDLKKRVDNDVLIAAAYDILEKLDSSYTMKVNHLKRLENIMCTDTALPAHAKKVLEINQTKVDILGTVIKNVLDLVNEKEEK